MQIVILERESNCCWSVKHMQSSNFLLMSNRKLSVLSFTLSLCYACHIGEARSVRDAGISFVGFEVFTAVSTKMAVFWVVAPCSLVEVYQRFRGPALQPRRQPSSGISFIFP
jgi:hypothetical protein